jgi:hypothetical protein
MMAIFSGTMVGMNGGSTSMSGFITGLHIVFWVMAAILLLAAILSYFRNGKSKKLDQSQVAA